MKNIQGNQKNLKLKDKKGRLVYKFKSCGNNKFTEQTYDKKGNVLTFKDSNIPESFKIYDKDGNILTEIFI